MMSTLTPESERFAADMDLLLTALRSEYPGAAKMVEGAAKTMFWPTILAIEAAAAERAVAPLKEALRGLLDSAVETEAAATDDYGNPVVVQAMTYVAMYRARTALADLRAALAGAGPAPEARCPSCGGRRWVDDENWTPDDPRSWDGTRRRHDGLIPCGACSEGEWGNPVGPAPEAQPKQATVRPEAKNSAPPAGDEP